jgi:ABC-type amino acid transport substrate-binding protein
MRALAFVVAWLALSPTAPSDTLRILTYEARPFFYRQDDEPAGLEYEILRFFAEARGHELQIRWVASFDELLPMLEQGEGDIAAAMLTRTPERQARFDFSESYFPVRVVLVEPAGQKTSDLGSLSGPIATIAGSIQEELLSDLPGVKFVYARDEREMFELVASGKARALAVDSAIAFPLLKEFKSFEIGIALTETQHYGFAVSKGSGLKEALSEHIRKLKASGIYFRLLERYLGSQAVEAVKAGNVR